MTDKVGVVVIGVDRKNKCLKREHKLEDPKNGEQCLHKAKSEVHIHNKVAKKGDAATSFLRRFHAHMLHHEVDLIGGDVNMSAFSTVGDVFPDGEFSAPGKPHQKGIQGLDESHKERTGFLIMPRRPYTWELTNMVATCLTMKTSGPRQAV